MAITKDKVASLLVFAAVITATILFLGSVHASGLALFVVLTVSFFGLSLVWLAEPLGEIGCFSRGIPLRSPPLMIEGLGWLFLVGYPTLLACLLA